METLLQKAQRMGMEPENKPANNFVGESLIQKAQRLGIQPENKVVEENKSSGGLLGYITPVLATLPQAVGLNIAARKTAETAKGIESTLSSQSDMAIDLLKKIKLEQDPIRKENLRQTLRDIAKNSNELSATLNDVVNPKNIEQSTEISVPYLADIPAISTEPKRQIEQIAGRSIRQIGVSVPALGAVGSGVMYGAGGAVERGAKPTEIATEAALTALAFKAFAFGAEKALGSSIGKKALSTKTGKLAMKVADTVFSPTMAKPSEFIGGNTALTSKISLFPENYEKAVDNAFDVTRNVFDYPFSIRGKAIKKLLPNSESIMNRVARLSPTQANQFKQITGMSHGQYLTETGNFGSPEKIIEREYNKFNFSKNLADNELSKLDGVYKGKALDTLLEELASRELRVSSPGAPSKDLEIVKRLVSKNNQIGLNMSEINQAKRLYEMNVKLGYLRENNTDAIARATNIDNALRKWQFGIAKSRGLKNLDAINKQTQASKFIADKLWQQTSGKTGNNAISLTDWIMLSGGDIKSIVGLGLKKTFGSKSIQSQIAKMLSESPTRGVVMPEYGSQEGFLLPPAKEGADTFSPLPMREAKRTIFEKSVPKNKQFYVDNTKGNIVKNPFTSEKTDLTSSGTKNVKIPKSSLTSSNEVLQNTLETEARKYKSAEEFVKSKPEMLLIGETNGFKKSIQGGIVQKIGDKQTRIYKNSNGDYIASRMFQYDTPLLKAQGVRDSSGTEVVYKTLDDAISNEKEWLGNNSPNITKSQLIDIWKKANLVEESKILRGTKVIQ